MLLKQTVTNLMCHWVAVCGLCESGPLRGHGTSRMHRKGARTVLGGRGDSNATSLLGDYTLG